MLGAGAGVALGGCGLSVDYTPTNMAPHAMRPRPPGAVKLFTSQPPRGSYVDVGYLEVRQQTYNHSSQSAIIQAMRREAGRRGCEGLVITGSANEVVGSGSSYNGQGSMSVRTLKGLRGSCIVFTSSASTPAASPRAAAAVAPGRACVPGATQACVGPGDCKGGQACKDDGSGWERCDCGPAAQPEAGVSGDAGAD